jgi:hypothetical protein
VKLLLFTLLAGCATTSRVQQAEWVVELRNDELRLSALAGYHVNPEYPIHFRGEGVSVERAQFTVEEKRAHAKIPRKPGTFAFSVCDANNCLIEKVDLTPK